MKNKKKMLLISVLIFSVMSLSMIDIGKSYSFPNGEYVADNSNLQQHSVSPIDETALLIGWGKEDNYIPEVNVYVSTDNGESWVGNTLNLTMKPFHLMFEISVRVPGKRLQLFGAKQIEANICFLEENVMDWSLMEHSVTLELLHHFEEDSDNIKKGSSIYTFKVPTSPIDDNALARGAKPQKATIIFECTPKNTGTQHIYIVYEDKVSDTFEKGFTLVIKP